MAAGMALLQDPLTAENLGRAATYSALANQVLLEKPDFPAFVERALQKPWVVGVNTAHSGTVAGVFFTEGDVYKRQAPYRPWPSKRRATAP